MYAPSGYLAHNIFGRKAERCLEEKPPIAEKHSQRLQQKPVRWVPSCLSRESRPTRQNPAAGCPPVLSLSLSSLSRGLENQNTREGLPAPGGSRFSSNEAKSALTSSYRASNY